MQLTDRWNDTEAAGLSEPELLDAGNVTAFPR